MAPKYKALPSPERLWEVFALNPLTGELFWRIRTSARCRLDGPAGCVARNGYIVIRIDGQMYGAHRLIRAWVDGTDPDPHVIDHWDRNPTNNRPWNLRLCSPSQNMANVPARGWYITSAGRYAAQVKYQKKRIALGEFLTPLEAYTAYITAKRLLFGAFACAEALDRL
jgi:hypothetical protein